MVSKHVQNTRKTKNKTNKWQKHEETHVDKRQNNYFCSDGSRRELL